jgi:hypothetical protein
MERYTLENHEAYRSQQDEKGAKEEEARNERRGLRKPPERLTYSTPSRC